MRQYLNLGILQANHLVSNAMPVNGARVRSKAAYGMAMGTDKHLDTAKSESGLSAIVIWLKWSVRIADKALFNLLLAKAITLSITNRGFKIYTLKVVNIFWRLTSFGTRYIS